MSNEPLPLPINVDPSDYFISASLIGVNKGATNDSKDVFFFGDYVSSGTKYAVLYRNTANARLTFAITSTEPSTTVAGTTAKSMQVAKLYSAEVVCGDATASRVAYVDGVGAILATKLPFTSSYAQLYAPKYNLVYSGANTFQRFGSNLLPGTLTSDWSMTPSTPGYGLLYTGQNAYIEVCYFVSYQTAQSTYTTIAVGAGVPTPTHTFAEQTQYSSASQSAASFATGNNRSIFTITNNDSIIPYTAVSVASTTTMYTVHLNVRVLGYI